MHITKYGEYKLDGFAIQVTSSSEKTHITVTSDSTVYFRVELQIPGGSAHSPAKYGRVEMTLQMTDPNIYIHCGIVVDHKVALPRDLAYKQCCIAYVADPARKAPYVRVVYATIMNPKLPITDVYIAADIKTFDSAVEYCNTGALGAPGAQPNLDFCFELRRIVAVLACDPYLIDKYILSQWLTVKKYRELQTHSKCVDALQLRVGKFEREFIDIS